MKKILLTILSLFLISQASFAATKYDVEEFRNVIHKTKVPKGAVSASLRDIKTGEVVNEINSDVQVSPASTQKILSYFSSLNTLGENYNFSTRLYKTKSGDYYIVLGADPYLTGKDLKELMSNIKIPKNEALKHLYIDDTILDNNTWGEGWQWDDSLNVLMPKFGAYNIDKNLYTVIIRPTVLQTPANIFTNVFYPTTFINQTLTVQSGNNIKITKDAENDISPDALTVNGEVSETTKVQVPVPYLRRYFILRLEEALSANKITYTGKFEKVKVPANAELIGEIKHPISNASVDILKNSNNMVAETVFKLAGAKYSKNTGSQSTAMAMFNNYCTTNKIDCSNIRLTDGSGVSKNNLVTANFMTEYLAKVAQNYGYDKVKTQLPTPGEGTLKYRMLLLKDKLFAKTGTLSNISGITGYIDTKNGNSYAFAIYVTDGNTSENQKKILEELLIKHVYNNK